MKTRFCVAAGVAASLLALRVGGASAATPLPPHLYAPYFETWTADSISGIAQQSHVNHFTLAFLESTGKRSCTVAWNGTASQGMSSGRYRDDILALRAAGGDVFPSFGGWSADQAGTEIADSCSDLNALVAAYESVITTYDVSRLDMDIEGRSLSRTAAIDRRNKAIKIVERWAADSGRPLQIGYTLPTSPSGLEPSGLAVLQNAQSNGTRVDVVNIMTFDYYDRVTTDMGGAAISAAQGLVGQLRNIYGTAKTDAELRAMVGITLMPGLDDYPRRTESTSVADAQRVYQAAKDNGYNTLSIWAIQRDNGGCPGTTGSNSCSGIIQSTWAFSNVLQPFTGP